MIESKLPYHKDSSVYFSYIHDQEFPVFLDSSKEKGQFDIISANPYVTIKTTNLVTTVTDLSGSTEHSENPFEILSEYVANFPKINDSEYPFIGGAIGFFGYDLCWQLLEIEKTKRSSNLQLPEMFIGIYNWAIVIDHHSQEAAIIHSGYLDLNTEYVNRLAKEMMLTIRQEPTTCHFRKSLIPNISVNQYRKGFKLIQDHLYNGDCYQANLTQRFSIDNTNPPFDVYRLLRKDSIAAYRAYLDYGDFQVLSLSPEQYISLVGGEVKTKPIKGTILRGDCIQSDKSAAHKLKNDPKEVAENLMIVDLMRNDISRVCKPGSVKVKKFCHILSLPNVHHLESLVVGRIQDGVNAMDLLKHCFPGGSITGAPKKSAIKIIEEAECHDREIYCGSIGYINFSGNMDTNICIRTLVAKDNHLYAWAGGAIVSDSKIDSEYQESLDKLKTINRTFSQ